MTLARKARSIAAALEQQTAQTMGRRNPSPTEITPCGGDEHGQALAKSEAVLPRRHRSCHHHRFSSSPSASDAGAGSDTVPGPSTAAAVSMSELPTDADGSAPSFSVADGVGTADITLGDAGVVVGVGAECLGVSGLLRSGHVFACARGG
eukprot:4261651-Alexandrium_andersonii.AAC.1